MSELEVYERVKGTGEVELYVVLHELTHACSRGSCTCSWPACW